MGIQIFETSAKENLNVEEVCNLVLTCWTVSLGLGQPDSQADTLNFVADSLWIAWSLLILARH